MEKATFENQRYITIGVQEEVSGVFIALMWEMIDNMKVESKSYFQVFNIYKLGGSGSDIEVIEHTQEEPDYSMVTYVNISSKYKGKVFVIDDGEASVMCLPIER